MTPTALGVCLLLALGLSGCDRTLPPRSFEGTAPEMRPDIFFIGTTRSSGILENRSGGPTGHFQVEGTGTAQQDGAFRLDQTIVFGQDQPRTRAWLLHRVDAHHYTGTLTDATGAVEAEAYGNLFHLRYPMKTPFAGRMEQWLYLQPDGRTVLNEATVSILGITVAHLSERITRQGP